MPNSLDDSLGVSVVFGFASLQAERASDGIGPQPFSNAVPSRESEIGAWIDDRDAQD